MKKVIITDPAHDGPTSHMSFWIKRLVSHSSQGSRVEVIRLKGDEATRENLLNEIKNHQPELVCLNGHGNAECICGYMNEVLVHSAEKNTTDSFTNKMVHSLACEAGSSLGHKLVDRGVTAFVGYQKKFKFSSFDLHVDENNHDPVADLFFEAAYEVPKQLSEGANVQEAYNKAQVIYAQNLQKTLTLNNPSSLEVAANLYHDFTNHVLIGNGMSTVGL
jgi:hypothetical protein